MGKITVGIIILCRFASSRLPGKILRRINGKTILQYIYERLCHVGAANNIVVATSEESSDDPIVEFCNNNDIQVYRGPLNNVAKRFLSCSLKFCNDYTTRINGDNLFVDIESVRDMISIAKKGKYDFISNVKKRTFPKGMSIEIIRTSYYKKCYENFSNGSHFEHVTLPLYENDNDKSHYYYFNTICPKAAGIQLAIDTIKDFETAEKIIANFSRNHRTYGLKDIYKFYSELK